MGQYVADRVARAMMKRGFPVVGSRILVLGLTFKENCPDIRNSKVVDVINALRDYNAIVDVHDPLADPDETKSEYGFSPAQSLPDASNYEAIVVAVAHREYLDLGAQRLRALGKDGAVLFDVKAVFPKSDSDGRL